MLRWGFDFAVLCVGLGRFSAASGAASLGAGAAESVGSGLGGATMAVAMGAIGARAATELAAGAAGCER